MCQKNELRLLQKEMDTVNAEIFSLRSVVNAEVCYYADIL